MKKTGFLVLLLTFISGAMAQSVSVPFRVGQQFGLSDPAGKLVLPPEYDVLEPSSSFEKERYFVGYKISDSSTRSSLIYKNKVLLSNQPYKHYDVANDLLIAREYLLIEGMERNRYGDEFNERCHLYDLEGKRVLGEDFINIEVVNELDEENKLNEVLIYTFNEKEQRTLRIYNKRLKKITKILVDQSADLYFRSEPSYYFNYKTVAEVYVYKNPAGEGQKLVLEPSGDSLKITLEKFDVSVFENKEKYSDGDMGFGFSSGNYGEKYPEGKGPRKVEVDLDKYYLPKKLEKIAITNDGFESGYLKVITKNGKKGLIVSESNEVVISARFDEIIEADFSDSENGYIVRTATKYGLFIYAEPANFVVEPIFTKIPLLENLDYFKKNDPLIKLYDIQGKFFCYANKAGKLYYAPK
jgi:hypothetical protein